MSLGKKDKVFLMMSSGNFGGIDFQSFSYKLFNNNEVIADEIPMKITQSATQTTIPPITNYPETMGERLIAVMGGFVLFFVPFVLYKFKHLESIKPDLQKIFNFNVFIFILWAFGYMVDDIFFIGFMFGIFKWLFTFIAGVYTLFNLIKVVEHQPVEYPRMMEFWR
jgi:hypothetical protein